MAQQGDPMPGPVPSFWKVLVSLDLTQNPKGVPPWG